MIVYRIISKQANSETKTIINSPDYSDEMAVRRAVQHAHHIYPVNCTIRLKGTSRKGTVTHIEDNLDRIMWEGNRPAIMYITMDDGERLCTTTSRLKRTK